MILARFFKKLASDKDEMAKRDNKRRLNSANGVIKTEFNDYIKAILYTKMLG